MPDLYSLIFLKIIRLAKKLFLKAKMLLLTLVVYIHFMASKRAVGKQFGKTSLSEKNALSIHDL